ncbi:MAG: hypothetical protein JNL98_39385, partial [Bryobacterales bacterium]|nr:hypothetical protein [Bryobacterales bacterium]
MISAGLHRTLRSRTLLRWCAVMLAALGVVRSCAFDGALREYLRVHFWMPFNKDVRSLAKAPKRESISPYAGLSRPDGDTALARLRAAYQTIAFPDPYGDPIPLPGAEKFEQAVAAARGAAGLTQQEREEIELIDAKIAMRLAERGEPAGLNPARSKMLQFLKTARTPEFASEARGWLARIYHLQGDSA